MGVLGFRLQEKHRHDGRDVADCFMAAFVAARFERAAGLMGERCSWFGEMIPRDVWTQRATQAHGAADLEAKRVHVIEGAVLAALDAELACEVLDGTFDEGHALQIFDVRRNDTWMSLGIVTHVDANGSASVARVVDLSAFKRRFMAA